MDTHAIGILAFFGALVLLVATLQGYVVERRRLYRTLRTIRSIELTASDVRKRELALPLPKRVVAPAFLRLGQAVRRLTPASAVERLRQELIYAGSPSGWDAERLLALKVLGTVVLFAAGLVVPKALGAPTFRAFILAVLLGGTGYYVPEWILKNRSAHRQESIRRTLPDALDLLSITVEAGLGFDAALARVARQVGGPIGEEMHRVLQEIQLGRPRSEALRDLADRSTVDELKSFVMAMVQADIFGIAIAKVLHVQAHEMRVKRRQRAEERAQKLPVKIVFPLILCIMPALFVVLLGPAAINIYRNIFGAL
ncbi:MAG: type II secretion system F family protein [Actinomycetota bacterium]